MQADGKVVIETDLETKSVDAQIKQLERKLTTMVRVLESDSQIDINLQMSDSERVKLESDIEKVKNRILSLKEQTNVYGKETEKVMKKTSDSYKKGNDSLRRFALSLFSVGSVYALVSKASTSYLSQDTELAKKLQSVWVGLGNFIAPLIEFISNALLKGIGYLNVFIKALTGIDFVARANAKALQKQTGATNEAVKSLSKLDEIENLDKQGAGGGIDTRSLIDIPELDNKLVKKLQELAKWLKENWDWISKVGIALGITFGALKIAGLLSNIGKLIGASGVGLTGLLYLLTALATAYIVYIAVKGVLEAIKQVEKLNKALEKNIKMQEDLNDKQKKISDGYWNLIDSGKATNEQIQSFIKYTDKATESVLNQIAQLESQKTILGEVTGSNSKLREQQTLLWKELEIVNNDYKKLYDQGLLSKEQTERYSTSLYNQITAMQMLGQDTRKLETDYKNLTGKDYKTEVKAVLTDNVTNEIKKLVGKKYTISFAVGGGAGAIGSSGGGGFRGYASGGIVTQPTRALIGEAGYNEAIVPMTGSYLSTLANAINQYMPRQDNNSINTELLLELNRSILELANKPTILNVNGQALAQATYKDYQNEGNRLNSSSSISIK